MKKALIKLTGVLVTTAIALSGNSLVLANEVDNTSDDVVTATEESAEVPGDDITPAPADMTSNEDEKNNTSDSQDKEPNEGTDSSKPESNDNTEPATVTTETQSIDVDVSFDYDNDELAKSYINHVFGIDSSASTKKAAKRAYDPSANLSEFSRFTYEILRNHFGEIATGRKTSTEIEFSIGDYSHTYYVSELVDNPSDTKGAAAVAFSKLGLDVNAVFRALLNSCPYELYWFDKTKEGCMQFSYSYGITTEAGGKKSVRITGVSAVFLVAEEYREDVNDLYTVGTTFSNTVKTAHDNALSIVNTYKDLDDYKKLEAYKNKICDLVDYNHPAADDDDTAYGNPWQLIWVFDGDDSTKVVCEGYSKAFQYLCDNTDFDSDDIYVICASGDVTLRSNTGSVTGGHMWNVVHMEDGKNYLVDVTNCDSGFLLFMKGYVKTLSNGYVVSNGRGQNNDYPYRETSLTLPLSPSDYTYTPRPKPEPVEAPEFTGTHGMALTDSVCVRFVVSFPDNFDTSNCYVTFNNTTSLTTKNTVYYADSLVREGNERYFTCEINVLELADYLTATLHYGDNKTITSDPYSAMDYINSTKNKNPDNTKLINLLNGLHAYGYYMQKSGWTDNKSHASIPSPAKSLSSADITSTINSLKSYSFVKNLGNSGLDDDVKLGLTLNSKTEFRVSVKPASGVSITSTGYTTKEIDGSTYYQYTVGKIGPKALGTPRSFTITTTKGTATITVPAIYYVNIILTKDKYNTNQKLALVAYYNYYSAAMAYN